MHEVDRYKTIALNYTCIGSDSNNYRRKTVTILFWTKNLYIRIFWNHVRPMESIQTLRRPVRLTQMLREKFCHEVKLGGYIVYSKYAYF